MKFLDVKTDFAFKKVFGSADSKDLLISFLNAVIEFDSKQIITDLTIVDPY
ncbi:MAG: Rpn family recombination-promoting nuclease/putative transposase, partial [Methyloprofundus sp.]|nr:Rpn family recombination-promoting nuclease/putative transposase [Methyloprofundus sp.]